MTHRPFWVCCEASWGSLVTLGDSVVSWRPLSTVKFPHASRLLGVLVPFGGGFGVPKSRDACGNLTHSEVRHVTQAVA